jgi:hypothetical protein
MNVGIIVAIVVVAIIIVAVVVWLVTRARRTRALREQFGPEYDRAVADAGDRREGESTLVERRERVQKLTEQPLSDAERQSFTDRWRNVQARFVDDPASAIGDADGLISEVMQTRGYPTDLAEQQHDVLMFEHPDVLTDYREAHGIVENIDSQNPDTEALRAAMLRYRSIFQELTSASAVSSS